MTCRDDDHHVNDLLVLCVRSLSPLDGPKVTLTITVFCVIRNDIILFDLYKHPTEPNRGKEKLKNDNETAAIDHRCTANCVAWRFQLHCWTSIGRSMGWHSDAMRESRNAFANGAKPLSVHQIDLTQCKLTNRWPFEAIWWIASLSNWFVCFISFNFFCPVRNRADHSITAKASRQRCGSFLRNERVKEREKESILKWTLKIANVIISFTLIEK